MRGHQSNEGAIASGLVSVAAGTITVVLAACYAVGRRGFPIDTGALYRAVGLSWAFASLPTVVGWLLLRRGSKLSWFKATGFLAVVAVLLAAAAGAVARYLPGTGWVAGASGVVSFAVVLWASVRRRPLQTALIVLGAALAGVWWASLAWGYGYANPLFLESIATRSASPTAVDTIFHVAIANMIKAYGTASTGLDGVVPLRYHVGSHWLFVQLASLLRIRLFDFYQFAFAILLYPLLSAMVPWLALAFRGAGHDEEQAHERVSAKFWLLWAGGIIGVIPLEAMTDLAIGWWRPVSESYTTSLIIAFGTLAAFFTFRNTEPFREVTLRNWRHATFLCIVLPILVIAAGVTKSSTMVLLGVAGGYSLLRLRLYRNRAWLLSASIAAFGSSLVLWLIRMPEFSTPFPLHFLIAHVEYSWFALWPVGYLLWVWVFAGLKLRSYGASTLPDLRRAFAEGRLFDLELITIVAVVGLIPGLLLAIPGQSAGYFSDPQRWIALAMVMGFVAHSPPRRELKAAGVLSLSRLVVFAVGGVLAASVVLNIALMARRFAKENLAIRAAFRQSLGTAKSDGHHNLPEYTLLNELHALDSAALPAERNTALFIPRENQVFWSLLPECQVPFLVPALTGSPLLGGLPRNQCPYFGFWTYATRPGGWSSGVVQAPHGCNRGRSLGFDHVAWLEHTTVSRDACQR